MYRAIIVDDIPIIRDRITKQIDESPYNVVTVGWAANGEEALEWLGKYFADICITDIRMPVLDGLGLIERIRDKYQWMSSVIISSYDEFEYAKKGIELEAVNYILKPVEKEILDSTLKKVTDKISKVRAEEAASLLLAGMNGCSKLLQKWIEHLKMTEPMLSELVEETVQVLSRMVGERSFLLEMMAQEWLNVVTAALKQEKISLNNLLENEHEFSKKALSYDENAAFYCSACNHRLGQGAKEIYGLLSDSKRTSHSRLIDNIINYIEKNYMRKELTLQEIADFAQISRNHMANLIKQDLGMTLWNYIVDLRIKKAKELLLESSMKNYEVAASVGYEDYMYFSQLFKEHTGMSPAEYRKKME